MTEQYKTIDDEEAFHLRIVHFASNECGQNVEDIDGMKSPGEFESSISDHKEGGKHIGWKNRDFASSLDP